MMHISTIATAALAGNEDFSGKTAVVIDVLRASSVIVTALSNGAKSVVPTVDIDEAFSLYNRHPQNSLLCGERDTIKINGFHLGNSPLEYTAGVISGKDLILCTSNGTIALRACQGATRIYIASFLNLDTVARQLAIENAAVMIVCSGTNGKFSLDDGLCAGMLIDAISKHNNVALCDLSQALFGLARVKQQPLERALQDCYHIGYLRTKGFSGDIDYCLRVNISECLPFWQHDRLRS
ncbi:MAG: 2-phosphosulfolactate phosphatase [Bacteroidales bacterium]|nr:2-phosphosulfolactate phosphatase [Bacteroidales bacterium]